MTHRHIDDEYRRSSTSNDDDNDVMLQGEDLMVLSDLIFADATTLRSSAISDEARFAETQSILHR